MARHQDFDHPAADVWIAKDASVSAAAHIDGPCIVDHAAEIRPCAAIRGSAIVGKQAVVGNFTELKNVVLFDRVQVPHHNYVGDSILGYEAHMGAGSMTCNVKSDKTPVSVKDADGPRETGRWKLGAILGDRVEIGGNTVLNPGSVIGASTGVYPLCSVRGVVPANSIYKSADCIVPRR